MKNNILLHIPHSSFFIPKEYGNLFLLSEKELKEELLKMTDSYTDILFNIKGVSKLVFPVSRLICDVERFRDEKSEEMAKSGMWVCYTKTSDMRQLKKVDNKHKKEILKKYYDAHHKLFENSVKNIMKKYNSCIIIDAHSFSDNKLPYEIHGTSKRPDICIGADNFHTPSEITEYFYEEFSKKGYKVWINNPFKGAIAPLKYYCKNKKVKSVMIEINRTLYMNEKTGGKITGFCRLKNDIENIIKNF